MDELEDVFNEGEGENEEDTLQYDLKPDSAFTKDEQKAIETKKAALNATIQKKQAVLKGLEAGFLNLSSYAIARWIVLSTGQSGVVFACVFVFLFNQIVNRECLDNFNLNYTEGNWTMLNGQKILKLISILIVSSFTSYLAVGDEILRIWESEATYRAIEEQVEVFSKASNDERTKLIQSSLFGVLVTLIVIGIYARLSK